MKRRVILILSCLFLSIGFITAQTTRVTGVVIDDVGEPVIGASVVVKGTTIGTITEVDGTFSINVPEGNNTLVFSLVGMKVVEAKASQNMRVVMQNDEHVLGDVVVTALGIPREKKALGYATQDVKSDKLNMTGNIDLTKSLQGKVVGVDLKNSSGMPGASSQIVIRGARSFDGDNTPLYVIDGMPIASTSPYDTGYSVSGSDIASRSMDIDPNDIESVNILRGQAAAALYGLRASNGAIIITTKSGKGKAIGKTNVALTQTVSFDVVSRTPDYQTTWAQGSSGSYVYNSSMSWGPKITDLPNDPTYGGNGKGHDGQYQVLQLLQAGYAAEDSWVTPGDRKSVV